MYYEWSLCEEYRKIQTGIFNKASTFTITKLQEARTQEWVYGQLRSNGPQISRSRVDVSSYLLSKL